MHRDKLERTLQVVGLSQRIWLAPKRGAVSLGFLSFTAAKQLKGPQQAVNPFSLMWGKSKPTSATLPPSSTKGSCLNQPQPVNRSVSLKPRLESPTPERLHAGKFGSSRQECAVGAREPKRRAAFTWLRFAFWFISNMFKDVYRYIYIYICISNDCWR